MAEPKLLRRVRLGPQHQPTGKTRHFHGNEPLPASSELRIVQYSSDPGFYLLYCDESGQELTDTYHDTLAQELAQAEWEFRLKAAEWEVVE